MARRAIDADVRFHEHTNSGSSTQIGRAYRRRALATWRGTHEQDATRQSPGHKRKAECDGDEQQDRGKSDQRGQAGCHRQPAARGARMPALTAKPLHS